MTLHAWIRRGSVITGALAAVAAGHAQTLTLNSGSSSLTLVTSGLDAGQAIHWLIGNTDHLARQDWFFRLSGSGPVSLLSSLGSPSVTSTADSADFVFSGQGIEVTLRYLLTGNGTTADIAEVVRVRNQGTSPLRFELFEFDDFNLGGTAGGDTVVRQNSSTMKQSEGVNSITVGVTPIPAFSELGGNPTLLNAMFAGGFSNLDPTLGSFGPGDASFAFQWAATINPGDAFLVSKDKLLVVPEPASIATLALLAGAAALRRRFKR